VWLWNRWSHHAHAYTDYYRDVTYKGLILGGIDGVDAIVNTAGLEKNFPRSG